MNDRTHYLAEQPDAKPKAVEFGAAGFEQTPCEVIWKHSLAALLLFGIIAGAILGAANGALAHSIAFDAGSLWTAAAWGSGLGIVGGLLTVLLRRIIWGADIGIEIGTVLGVLYGIVPGVALMFESIIVHRVILASWSFVGLVMASSMMGLLIGGVLDRVAETIIARQRRRQPERGTTVAARKG